MLQCDETVQKEDVICSKEELDRLFTDFEIYGGGGTDFRPAFERVQELIEQGRLNGCAVCYILRTAKAFIRLGSHLIKRHFCF